MSEPLVSVKMITYNHAPYIAKAIECVINQKVEFPFELVIGEDCSTDGTREIVIDYQKKYPDIIRVITSDENVGAKKNGYRTTMACRGKYIAFCEGDDFWHCDEKMTIQTSYLEQTPECGLVFSNYDLYYYDEKKKIENYNNTINKKIEKPCLIDIVGKKVDIRTCTVQARNDLIVKIINNDSFLHQSDYFQMGDIQLWAEISAISKLHYIDKSLSTYQITKNSVTQSRNIKKRFSINDCEMYLYLCKKYNLPKYIRRSHEEKWKRECLIHGFILNDIKIAQAVKKRVPFSVKDWVWYFGTKYYVIRKILMQLSKVKKYTYLTKN